MAAKYGALTSGGKDSSYAIYLALQNGVNIAKLITIRPKREDSYMYHSHNLHLLELYSKACGIPLIMQESSGIEEEELEDLKIAISRANIDGIITGAIASEYQASRIKHICSELGIEMLSPLWKKDQELLLRDMVKTMEIVIIHVAAEGLNESWLGRKLDEAALADLLKLRSKYRINIAGEGGEYETFVTNAPFFKKRINIKEAKSKWYGNRGTLEIKTAELV
ncbi:MAG: TIGR00289 family protein [Methanocellales archaeon]